MNKYEAGKWPPYNVNYIVGNVRSVLKNRDMDKLSQGAYKFITSHMGFIAHYDLCGFQGFYAGDLTGFAENLLTGESGGGHDYNQRFAERYANDSDFNKWYGRAYCQSVTDTMLGIIAVAKDFLEKKTAPRKSSYQVARVSRRSNGTNFPPSMFMTR